MSYAISYAQTQYSPAAGTGCLIGTKLYTTFDKTAYYDGTSTSARRYIFKGTGYDPYLTTSCANGNTNTFYTQGNDANEGNPFNINCGITPATGNFNNDYWANGSGKMVFYTPIQCPLDYYTTTILALFAMMGCYVIKSGLI